MTGRQRLPALAVVAALATLAVVALGDPDAAISEGAMVVAAGAMVVVFISVSTGIEYRDQHPFPFGLLLLRLSPVPVVLLAILSVPLLPDNDQGGDDVRGGVGLGDRSDEEAKGNEKVSDVIDAVYAGLAVVAIVAAVYLMRRLIRHAIRLRRDRTSPAPGRSGTVTESDDPERWRREAERRAVRTGLAHGRTALLDEADPRVAIVRAYLVFEDHVRHEGLVREPAETQREYAARVLAAGGVREPRHVTELVELFNAARFSTDPMGEADAVAARDHIDALVDA